MRFRDDVPGLREAIMHIKYFPNSSEIVSMPAVPAAAAGLAANGEAICHTATGRKAMLFRISSWKLSTRILTAGLLPVIAFLALLIFVYQ